MLVDADAYVIYLHKISRVTHVLEKGDYVIIQSEAVDIETKKSWIVKK